jgi:hypothetical protein
MSSFTLDHKVLTYIEYRAVFGVFRTIDPSIPPPQPPQPPLHPASVSSRRTKGGGYTTHSPGGEGVGGSIFRKTPDIGLASYSIISLRLGLTDIKMGIPFRNLPPILSFGVSHFRKKLLV